MLEWLGPAVVAACPASKQDNKPLDEHSEQSPPGHVQMVIQGYGGWEISYRYHAQFSGLYDCRRQISGLVKIASMIVLFKAIFAKSDAFLRIEKLSYLPLTSHSAHRLRYVIPE